MSVTLKRINRDEVEPLIKRLFSPEFVSQELGAAGRWHGRECEHRLGLVGRVDQKALENLLLEKSPSGMDNPGGAWRGAEQPAGWLATFEVNRHHRTLWAVGDRETRKMTEVVHGFAVRSTLDHLDNAIRKNAGFRADDRVGAAYAMFDSGTGPGQIPGLRSTVIIPQGHLLDDGSVMTFPPMLMRLAGSRVDMAYKSEFLPRAYHVFGRVGFGEADVPRGLFKPLASDYDVTAAGSVQGALVFKGEDIFTQWQRQAQARKFGPDQVAEVLSPGEVVFRGIFLAAIPPITTGVAGE